MMKQHTDAIQTMRLKDLGFPAPKSVSKLSLDWDMDTVPTFDYSIGELIEIMGYDLYSIHYKGLAWEVKSERVETREAELIDALYDMIVKLKKEGVI